MVSKLPSLTIDIGADVARLDRDMRQASRAVKQSTDKIADSAKFATGAIAGIASAIGAGAFLGKLVTTAREFDVINASLITATGSADNAAIAFDAIQEFAATTPFGINELTSAFIKLKNLGLDPSEAALLSYGNTAAALGKSLDQTVEAVADAVTGEFERLKEFGIRASSEGDRVTFTFRGISTNVGKNAAEIEGYLRGLGDIEFAGAVEQRAATLDGALSNLRDSFDGLFRSATADGGSEQLTESVRQLTSVLQDPATVESIRAISNGIIRGFGAAANAVNNLRIGFEDLRGIDSLATIQKEIEDIQRTLDGTTTEKLAALFTGKSGLFGEQIEFFGPDGLISFNGEEELRARLDELIAKRAELLAPASSAPEPDALAQFSPDPVQAPENTQAEDAAVEAEKRQQDLADRQRERAEKSLEDIQRFLLSEEEAIRDSYNRRALIVLDSADLAGVGPEEQSRILSGLEDRQAAELQALQDRLDSEQAAIEEAQAAQLESVRRALLSQEEIVQESYDRRKEIILASTEESSQEQVELLRRNQEKLNEALESSQPDEESKGFDGLFGQNALEFLFRDFENIEDRFKQLLATMLAEAIAQNISSAILGSGFGGGSTSGGLGAAFASVFGGGRASGGPVEAGKVYKVGERGQEYFAPGMDGTIIPNGASGSGGQVIHMTINTPDADSFIRSEGQAQASAARMMRRASRNL